jgi:hypothetical protein
MSKIENLKYFLEKIAKKWVVTRMLLKIFFSKNNRDCNFFDFFIENFFAEKLFPKMKQLFQKFRSKSSILIY